MATLVMLFTAGLLCQMFHLSLAGWDEYGRTTKPPWDRYLNGLPREEHVPEETNGHDDTNYSYHREDYRLSSGAIAGIVTGSICLFILKICFCYYRFGRRRVIVRRVITTSVIAQDRNPYHAGYDQGASSSSTAIPMPAQGVPITTSVPKRQGPPPPNMQGLPLNRQGPPPNMQGLPLNMQGRPPVNMQGPPPNRQGPPPNMQGLPPNMQGPPPSRQGPPPNMQGPPPNMQGPPPNRQGPAVNMQGPLPDMRDPPPPYTPNL